MVVINMKGRDRLDFLVSELAIQSLGWGAFVTSMVTEGSWRCSERDVMMSWYFGTPDPIFISRVISSIFRDRVFVPLQTLL